MVLCNFSKIKIGIYMENDRTRYIEPSHSFSQSKCGFNCYIKQIHACIVYIDWIRFVIMNLHEPLFEPQLKFETVEFLIIIFTLKIFKQRFYKTLISFFLGVKLPLHFILNLSSWLHINNVFFGWKSLLKEAGIYACISASQFHYIWIIVGDFYITIHWKHCTLQKSIYHDSFALVDECLLITKYRKKGEKI